MLISACGALQFTRLVIDKAMALGGAVYTISPVQTRIKPLRGIRRSDLRGEHKAHLVIKGARIRFGVEITTFPAPIGPAAREAVKDLPGIALAAQLKELLAFLRLDIIGNMAA